jgi:hypothetical protein
MKCKLGRRAPALRSSSRGSAPGLAHRTPAEACRRKPWRSSLHPRCRHLGTRPGRDDLVTDSVPRLLGAAADLRRVTRGYQDEIECEQRLPASLIDQLRAAGVYRMVVPCALGGLQVDAPTHFRSVELLAEGDGSVGWNIATNAVSTLHILNLPDDDTGKSLRTGLTWSLPARPCLAAPPADLSETPTPSRGAGASGVVAAPPNGWLVAS